MFLADLSPWPARRIGGGWAAPTGPIQLNPRWPWYPFLLHAVNGPDVYWGPATTGNKRPGDTYTATTPSVISAPTGPAIGVDNSSANVMRLPAGHYFGGMGQVTAIGMAKNSSASATHIYCTQGGSFRGMSNDIRFGNNGYASVNTYSLTLTAASGTLASGVWNQWASTWKAGDYLRCWSRQWPAGTINAWQSGSAGGNTIVDNTNQVAIGGDSDGTNSIVGGGVAWLLYLNIQLSADEIVDIWNNPFDMFTPVSVMDLVGNTVTFRAGFAHRNILGRGGAT
jgi:hypothetical protein